MKNYHPKSRFWLVAIAALMAGAMAPAPAAWAETRDVDQEARRIFLDLMSPYCPGQSLYSCRSSYAEILRNNIRQRLAAGETREEIIASLVDEFGESILGAPPNRGLARAAWIGPIAMLLVGAVIVFWFLRKYAHRMRREEKLVEVDPSMRARLEEEIKTHQG
jgi:cytochrome c-type biogenesis protein CcmH